MSAGTAERTFTAFWEYLLWLEICYKLLEARELTNEIIACMSHTNGSRRPI